jgi:HemY protein
MWRALVFVGLLCLGAFGAVWLADRPGTILITFGGYEVRTTVAVGAIVLAGIAFLLAVLWAAVTMLLRLPGRLGSATRNRRRSRGYQAVSRGMVAVGAGDPIAARRYAGEAERYLGQEPLALLLKAQAAQVSGNRAAAEAAFTRMMDDRETRVLGLRGLFVEARRRGDVRTATQHAAEAVRLAPAATWASDAVLEAQCANRDWRGAIEAVERRASLGLLDKTTAKRQRAVLLTADALDRVEHDREGALAGAQEAVRLAPDLVPSAALAGKLLSQRGDLRRAAKIVEAAWRANPHPDLADVYLNLRPGDSALDRLRRAETLAKLSNWSPEARLAVARAAMEAREFSRALATLEPLAEEHPTIRICLLMSDLEQAEHGATGRGREWLARAARAPRDPVWMADGVVSDHWAPISPVTGRLDAFVWQAPPDVLVAPELTIADDVTADLDDEPRAIAIPPKTAEPLVRAEESRVEAPLPETVPAPPASAPAADAPPVAAPARPEVVAERMPEPAAPAALAASADPVTAPAAETPPSGPAAKPTPVVFPVDYAPDDPGAEAEPKPERRGLFG